MRNDECLRQEKIELKQSSSALKSVEEILRIFAINHLKSTTINFPIFKGNMLFTVKKTVIVYTSVYCGGNKNYQTRYVLTSGVIALDHPYWHYGLSFHDVRSMYVRKSLTQTSFVGIQKYLNQIKRTGNHHSVYYLTSDVRTDSLFSWVTLLNPSEYIKFSFSLGLLRNDWNLRAAFISGVSLFEHFCWE